MQSRNGRPRGSRRRTQAQSADRYTLYEASVQDVEFDCDLIERMFQRRFGRAPRLLREDFCGSAAMACEWVRRDDANCAFGIDLDPEPLEWSRRHHVATLTPEEASRLALVRGDVLDVDTGPLDVIAAFNFSYFVFKQRSQLLGYFEKSRARLRREGLFVLDLYGGADSHRTLTETRELDGFWYVWDQDLFDPISYRAINHIHFNFPDGSRLEKAFTYDWRLWSLPELRDLLLEAGFSHVQPYWERTDLATNEGNGVYYPAKGARDDPAWVAYLAAFR